MVESSKAGNKSALIVTINNTNYNYGNRLQNYAADRAARKLGLQCRTLCFERSRFHGLKLRLKRMILRLTGYRLTSNPKYWKEEIRRDLSFLDFDKKNIKMLYARQAADVKDRFDYYFIGSDQVWNPLWYNEKSKNYYLLTFAPDRKKVCMAPSFGIDALPPDWTEWFQSNLSRFPRLAVREESGARLVKALTGRDAAVVVDPTMLLSAQEWQAIEKKPNWLDDKPFVLTYFLSPKSDDAKHVLEAAGEGKTVFELLDRDDACAWGCGPSEFLYLFRHAELILTDSFHACVFSFLFNRPFLVFDRCTNVDMNSRLSTLLKNFDLVRKYHSSGLENDIWEHDYSEGHRRLEEERKKAFDFLEGALEG